MLTLFIEKYDEDHGSFKILEPFALLKSLMKEDKMRPVDWAKLLHVSEGLVSDKLNYKKGLSKDTIRILADEFKLSQEAFNRPYELHLPVHTNLKYAKTMKNRKKLAVA